MTALTKPLRRESGIVRRDRGRDRPVIVSLEPGNIIGFRLKGTRTTYRLPIGTALALAVQATATARREARKAARKR